MRATDTDTGVHPAAKAREHSRRLRFWAGCAGAALCVIAFLVALARDNTTVLLGSFLGIMVAGNVIPFSEVKSLIPGGKGQ